MPNNNKLVTPQSRLSMKSIEDFFRNFFLTVLTSETPSDLSRAQLIAYYDHLLFLLQKHQKYSGWCFLGSLFKLFRDSEDWSAPLSHNELNRLVSIFVTINGQFPNVDLRRFVTTIKDNLPLLAGSQVVRSCATTARRRPFRIFSPLTEGTEGSQEMTTVPVRISFPLTESPQNVAAAIDRFLARYWPNGALSVTQYVQDNSEGIEGINFGNLGSLLATVYVDPISGRLERAYDGNYTLVFIGNIEAASANPAAAAELTQFYQFLLRLQDDKINGMVAGFINTLTYGPHFQSARNFFAAGSPQPASSSNSNDKREYVKKSSLVFLITEVIKNLPDASAIKFLASLTSQHPLIFWEIFNWCRDFIKDLKKVEARFWQEDEDCIYGVSAAANENMREAYGYLYYFSILALSASDEALHDLQQALIQLYQDMEAREIKAPPGVTPYHFLGSIFKEMDSWDVDEADTDYFLRQIILFIVTIGVDKVYQGYRPFEQASGIKCPFIFQTRRDIENLIAACSKSTLTPATAYYYLTFFYTAGLRYNDVNFLGGGHSRDPRKQLLEKLLRTLAKKAFSDQSDTAVWRRKHPSYIEDLVTVMECGDLIGIRQPSSSDSDRTNTPQLNNDNLDLSVLPSEQNNLYDDPQSRPGSP